MREWIIFDQWKEIDPEGIEVEFRLAGSEDGGNYLEFRRSMDDMEWNNPGLLWRQDCIDYMSFETLAKRVRMRWVASEFQRTHQVKE